MTRKKVYVCAPFGGRVEDVLRNTKLTMDRCRDLFVAGFEPVAPQIYYPRFLDDANPAERAYALDRRLDWLSGCDMLMIFGDRITDGMRREIDFADEHDILIVHRKEESRQRAGTRLTAGKRTYSQNTRI